MVQVIILIGINNSLEYAKLRIPSYGYAITDLKISAAEDISFKPYTLTIFSNSTLNSQ